MGVRMDPWDQMPSCTKRLLFLVFLSLCIGGGFLVTSGRMSPHAPNIVNYTATKTLSQERRRLHVADYSNWDSGDWYTVTVCRLCPSYPAIFLVPHASLLPFSIHPPEVLGLSLLFPSPGCTTHLLTVSTSIISHQLCQFVTVVVCVDDTSLVIFFGSCHVEFLRLSFCQPEPVYLPVCLSVCYQLPICLPACISPAVTIQIDLICDMMNLILCLIWCF